MPQCPDDRGHPDDPMSRRPDAPISSVDNTDMVLSRRSWWGYVVSGLAALTLLSAGCGTSNPNQPPDDADSQQAAEPGQLPEAGRTVIVFLGDSLTAGLGLPMAQSYPSRLQEMFTAEGYDEVEILNAGVSGDTTAGGLRRVGSLLTSNVRILVVALGGNDALRGLGVAQTHDNVEAIVSGALDRGVRVLVAGMESPTNLGEDYRLGFRQAFTRIADDFRGRITFVPFLLEGVAGNPSLNQADGIHPNEAGARKVADLLYPSLRDMVDALPVRPQ
jgi:acyl-CoA thioesterase-1